MQKKSKNKSPVVFDYLDYRLYMADYFSFCKAHVPGFSQRRFIQEAGLPISCSSLWPAIVKGRRNLSTSLKIKFMKAMKLGKREGQYFDILVDFNQAKGIQEKNHFFQQLSKFTRSRANLVKAGQMEFFSKWYYAAVRNFFGINQKTNNPMEIANSVLPSISVPQVKQSIKLLLELGLIEKTANGYQVTSQHIKTEPDVKHMTARENIKEMNHIAMEVFHQVPPSDRQYNNIMFSVSKKGVETIKERVRSFMEELREIVDHDNNEDRIYTLSMQLFPNSKLPGK